jgi:hypothetical protein
VTTKRTERKFPIDFRTFGKGNDGGLRTGPESKTFHSAFRGSRSDWRTYASGRTSGRGVYGLDFLPFPKAGIYPHGFSFVKAGDCERFLCWHNESLWCIAAGDLAVSMMIPLDDVTTLDGLRLRWQRRGGWFKCKHEGDRLSPVSAF